MAKAIFVSARHQLPFQTRDRIKGIIEALTPDGLSCSPPVLLHGEKTLAAVINPGPLVEVRNESLLLGRLAGEWQDWDSPGQPSPDGSFALFRNDHQGIEILTDPGGSRTIWYFLNDQFLLASTSQLAIVMFLGSFYFNPETIPWMLSTSSLGPGLSWDWRIRPLGPESSLFIDRESWTPQRRSAPIRFEAHHRSRADHKACLEESLYRSLSSFDEDLNSWAISLSGGYDSRSILALIKRAKGNLSGLKALTWGTHQALEDPYSDASIARAVADSYGVPHQYFPLDETMIEADVIVDRFLRYGEGRVDHIAGYLDGFSLWQTLANNGITGMIRGDEGFGLKVLATSSDLQVRLSVRLGLCTDFANLRNYRDYGLPVQEIPASLQIDPEESLSSYRDRLFHQYKLPFVVSALGDLKSTYIDQVNPLLSREILQAMRTLPDELRDQKLIFREIIDSLGPDVPIARRTASLRTCEAIQRPDLLEWIERELCSSHARSVLPPDLVDRFLGQFQQLRAFQEYRRPGAGWLWLKQALHRHTSRVTPRAVKNLLLRSPHTHHLDVGLVAWRLALISRVTALFKDAAQAGARRNSIPSSAEVHLVTQSSNPALEAGAEGAAPG